MKKAWLWIVDWGQTTNGRRITADLFFSSPEAFYKNKFQNLSLEQALKEQLVMVWVPENFDDWDYIPDNY